ncbi:MAG: hypothetical protein JNK66_10815 [Chitinophagales bacterium]|nr:hypothetical protein [Chitinophagales bacterium]
MRTFFCIVVKLNSKQSNCVWNAGDTGSGVYYYRVVGCDDKRYTGKLIKY